MMKDGQRPKLKIIKGLASLFSQQFPSLAHGNYTRVQGHSNVIAERQASYAVRHVAHLEATVQLSVLAARPPNYPSK